MKIEPRQPLPEHTKLDYYECYAKVILEDLFNDRYGNLIIKDKPDLQNCELNIGVEVTSAISKEHREAVKLWYMMPYVNEKQQERNKERMKQLGEEYQGGIQAWATKSYSCTKSEGHPIQDFIKIVENKIRKLNQNNYSNFKEYDLFVDSELYVAECLFKQVLEKLITINKGIKVFSYIYLLARDKILLFDMREKKFQTVEYIDKQFGYAMMARNMVIQGEMND